MSETRKLAAILVTDVVGCSSLMSEGRESAPPDGSIARRRRRSSAVWIETIARRWHVLPSASVLRTTTPTRNVVLTERQEQLVERLVKPGRYQNASEVLRDGLRLVEQREAEDAGKLEAQRAAARVGVSALDRGDFKEFRDIEDLQAYLNNLSDKVISRAAG